MGKIKFLKLFPIEIATEVSQYDWAKEIYKFVESLDYYNDWDERDLH